MRFTVHVSFFDEWMCIGIVYHDIAEAYKLLDKYCEESEFVGKIEFNGMVLYRPGAGLKTIQI